MKARTLIDWNNEGKKPKKPVKRGKYEGVIGIDLGTTNCVISYITENGEIRVIPIDKDHLKLPSFIEIQDGPWKSSYRVGNYVKDHFDSIENPVLYSFKPHVGTDKILYEQDGIKYTAQFCQSIMLKHMEKIAREYLDIPEDMDIQAVITVPAYFDENRKYDTKEAADKIGLKVMRLLEEPSASAFLAMYEKGIKPDGRNVVVYDLGGGTFDVSVVYLFSDSASVVNIDGNSQLGGDDYDRAIEDFIVDKFPQLRFIKDDTENYQMFDRKLKSISEKLKIELSNEYQRSRDKDLESNIYTLKHDGEEVDIYISYREFEECTRHITDETIKIFDRAVKEYGLTYEEIDNIVMTGGSSNLSVVKDALIEYLEKEDISDEHFRSLKSDIETFRVNPDLSVGMGAGVYAKIIADGDEGRRITNIVTHNLGIKDDLGNMEVLIRKGQEIFKRIVSVKDFIPDRDDSDKMEIIVYEGDDIVAENNTLVKRILIDLPEHFDREKYIVSITFTLTSDKILTISVTTPDNYHREKVEVESQNVVVNSEEAYSEMKTCN